MAELGILAGVGVLGYLLSQNERDSNFERNNDQQLGNYLMQHPKQEALATMPQVGKDMSCADSYPLYSPEYVKHQQNAVSGLPTPKNPAASSPVNRSQKIMQHNGHQENFTNFMPANDPTSDNLLDMKERPTTDFYHNNMVPFFRGDGTNQNMAGTGVAQGGVTFGENVNAGYDNTTPHQTTLATFTGLDDTYLHKRETGPLFSPAETATGWVYGQPNFRPDRDRYTQSLNNYRHDLKPVEPQMVGPGLNLDADIPAQGGFHEFTRILPNNVNDYKANQLPGRVQRGKYFAAGLPTSYPGVGVSKEMNPNQTTAPGVVKNKPESFWDQARYPTMTNKVGFQGNYDYNRSDYQADFKPNNALRDQTSFGLGNITYKESSEKFGNIGDPLGKKNLEVCVDQNINIGQGPLGAHVPQTGQRSETYMSQDNNIRSVNDCNSLPIINAARPGFGQGNIVSNWYVNETDRGTVNPTNLLPVQAQPQGTTFWMAKDEPNTTRKETTYVPFVGNAQREGDGKKFWTYKDEPSTTRRETTQTPFVGNAARGDQGTEFWTYKDSPNTTRKETTYVPYVGGAGRPGDAMMNRMEYTGVEVEIPV